MKRLLKVWRRWKKKGRRGAVVILVVFAMGVAAFTIAVKFYSDAHDEWAAARMGTEGLKARQLALAGFQAGLGALKNVPEEYLFQSGLALDPPDLQVSDECSRCFVKYSIQPEDGKLNVNRLVRPLDDMPDDTYRNIFQRLFSQYGIPLDAVDSLVDWIDENDTTDGQGAEKSYYENLKPPITIKNGLILSVSEMAIVKDLNRQTIYESKAPPNWEEEQEELKFQTEDEKSLLTPADWIPANNLTAYITPDGDPGKINVNAARYHVLMSLSDSMTREAVLEIFKLRREKGGYIKELSELQHLPSLQRTTSAGVSLYSELAGAGGEFTGLLKTEGEIYRIIGIGTIMPPENGTGSPVIRKVTGLYDRKRRKLLFYSEE
ncbi:MAG: general secretion pathway protein GspK [Leptonema illini]|uniref:General secretion pathway protein GspK n=1 Tax=Leptonema illini TaxID=183 RepID=A0A833LWL2_9LEPT|nr:MAG: general secretion pathway protein GspK [Leptonema illini]